MGITRKNEEKMPPVLTGGYWEGEGLKREKWKRYITLREKFYRSVKTKYRFLTTDIIVFIQLKIQSCVFFVSEPLHNCVNKLHYSHINTGIWIINLSLQVLHQ